jgi:hypothetical protein
VTSFANFFISEQKLEESVKLVNKYQTLQKEGKDTVNMSITDQSELKQAIMIKNSAYNGDELIPKVLRMSSFLPVNVPICVLILLAPPTMKNTIFSQWLG